MAKLNEKSSIRQKSKRQLVNLEKINEELKQSLFDLHQKIETLDAKPELLSSHFENFRENAEYNARAWKQR